MYVTVDAHCVRYDVNMIILGDLNVNMFKPNSLKGCLEVNGITNMVKEATCVKGKPSLIDMIVTNKPKIFQHCISKDVGLSDFHNIVCIATKCHVPKHKATQIEYRSYRTFSNDLFFKDVSQIPYHVIEIFDDVEDSYWMWITLRIDNNGLS